MSVSSNAKSFSRELEQFSDLLADLPATEQRRIVSAVGEQTARNLEGVGGLPRRIDTRSLQGAYLRLRPDSSGRVVVDSEYAAFIEEGTLDIAPGGHLAAAIETVGADESHRVETEIIAEWG